MNQTLIRVLIDAGPLVSLLSPTDKHHQRCVDQAKQLRAQPLTCWPAVAEAAHLLKRTHDGVHSLLQKLEERAFVVLPLDENDAAPISSVLEKYDDQGFDLADACLMHLAQREGIVNVFTLDHRHFSIFRTDGGQALNLLPESVR